MQNTVQKALKDLDPKRKFEIQEIATFAAAERSYCSEWILT
jgi:hypothetical protein